MDNLTKDDDIRILYLNRKKILKLRAILLKKYTKVTPHYIVRYDLHPHELFKFRNDPLFNRTDAFCESYANDVKFCYEEYNYPQIVDLINKILNGDYEAYKLALDFSNCDGEMSSYYKQLVSYVSTTKVSKNSTLNTEMSSEKIFKNFVKRLTRRK